MTTSLSLFFQKAERLHSKSQKAKKSFWAKNFFEVFLCTRQKQFWQVCQRIFGHYLSSKDSKTISLWVFQFFIRMMFYTCISLIWQPFLVFFHQKGSETFAGGTRTMKSFEKLEKNTFFRKNCSGHSRISLDNRDELFLA